MNEQADQPATPGSQPGIPGKTLQSQREALGWSVEQVADQLKLAPRQVVALEAGDYASLPSPAVTRGFVRVYAKLLKIDAAPLVSMIELNMPPEAQAGATSGASAARREQRPATFSETRFPIAGRRNRLPLGWIAAVVVVAGAAVAAWQMDLIPNLSRDGEAGGATVLENPAAGVVAPGAAAPGAAPAHGAQPGLINPSVPLISVPAPAAEGTQPAAPENNAPAPTTPPAAGTPSATAPGATPAPSLTPAAAAVTAVAAAGANTLVLNVREDSWVEVRPSAGGRPLISRLVKAGSTESVELTGPATLVVGAPGGVSATLRGAAVALPQQPGKTIARVALK
ncbi:RodZ domain-containing protein [Massilia sp. HP4]|uniref:RodZ domain-containing protein n=1 Tax=Massilia sp. HP4 TaxID=2562316 RepID=UPI0010BFADFF|nr:RodZ domain-containing protein [Massilia sp. HP4]